MARLPRLALAGHTHLVLQCAHAGLATALFEDELDRQAYSTALFAAAAEERKRRAAAEGRASTMLMAESGDDGEVTAKKKLLGA
jgi:hypothetical protein